MTYTHGGADGSVCLLCSVTGLPPRNACATSLGGIVTVYGSREQLASTRVWKMRMRVVVEVLCFPKK